MEETSKAKQSELAWGSIANLVERIIGEEEKIEGGWPEVVNMVADAMTDAGEGKDLYFSFSVLFNFVYHLLYRLKADPEKRSFNQISHSPDKEGAYRITNYDYKMLKWAKGLGTKLEFEDDWVDIPADKLTNSQREAFEARCQKEA